MLKRIIKKTRLLDLRTRNKINSLFAGNYRSAFRGRGIEFADIRPYDMGDDVRDIDWKTSSKQGELYVKTYHESRDNTLFCVIDGSAALDFSSSDKKKYEVLLETFALLAFSAVQNGDRVGAVFYGRGNPKIFPPKKGRKNILNILTFCIAQYENLTANSVDSPEEIFKIPQHLLKHSSTIFWLTGTLAFSEKIQKRIKMLRIKHDFIPMVFSDPLEENWTETGNFSFQDSFSGKIRFMCITRKVADLYSKKRQMQKKAFQRFFQKNRMEILFITTTENIFAKLYLFFQLRQKHFI